MVQWEIPEVIGFLAKSADDHTLHRNLLVADNAVAIAEPSGRIKILLVFKLLVSYFYRQDAVECQSEQVGRRLRELDQGIPALVEQLDKIRVKFHGRLGGFGTIPAVVDLHPDTALHRFDELVEIVSIGWNGFEKNSFLD